VESVLAALARVGGQFAAGIENQRVGDELLELGVTLGEGTFQPHGRNRKQSGQERGFGERHRAGLRQPVLGQKGRRGTQDLFRTGKIHADHGSWVHRLHRLHRLGGSWVASRFHPAGAHSVIGLVVGSDPAVCGIGEIGG